ncbi:hypothetical protein [Polaribacter ponticola]|uniref:hypothetical protein n=1 Tax=Polaribacter ponticola TaxID=2978475 RepID=UPI0030822EE4
MKNIFTKSVTEEIIRRVNNLSSETKANWGKMSVAQMLAHCSVTYEMIYTDKHPKPNGLVKLMLKLFVKNAVVSEKEYKKTEKQLRNLLFLIKENSN